MTESEKELVGLAELLLAGIDALVSAHDVDTVATTINVKAGSALVVSLPLQKILDGGRAVIARVSNHATGGQP